MRYLLLLFILASYIQKSYSQEEKEKPIFFKNIETVIVTGQIDKKSAESAVHKVRVITGKKLKSGLFTDLGQVLEKELNIRLSQDNILGSSISLQRYQGRTLRY